MAQPIYPSPLWLPFSSGRGSSSATTTSPLSPPRSTYYGVLAAVPGLVVVFTALGLFGKSVTNRVVAEVNSVAPGSSGHFVHNLMAQAQSHKSGTGVTAVVGIVIALWSASSYVNAFRRASNVIYGIGEGRPVGRRSPCGWWSPSSRSSCRCSAR